MYKLKNLKHIFAIWIITIVLIFGVMRLLGNDFLVPVTQFFVYRDAPFQNFIYRHEWQPSTDKIAIIKIDDNSLNEYQSKSVDNQMLTISKGTYADLTTKLESVGVKGIAFDIVFQNIDPEEKQFLETLSKYTNITLGTTNRCVPKLESTIVINDPYIQCDGSMDAGEIQSLIEENQGKDFLYNIPKCYKDTESEIYTCDGFPRSLYNTVPYGLLAIDSHVYKKNEGLQIISAPYDTVSKIIPTLAYSLYNLTHREVPKNIIPGKLILQPFFGGEGIYPSVPLSEVLKMSKVDLVKNFAGKYIFIGDTSKTNHDMVNSPITGTQIAGVETHAHMLDGLLQDKVPTEVSITEIIILIILLSGVFTLLYFLLPQYISPFLAIGAAFFFIWFGRYMYGSHDQVYTILPLMLAGSIFSFPVTFIYRFFIVDREKRKIQKDFGHYVDPRVVAEISESGHDIELGGERRPMTVMFSDIAGFTTISEKLAPNDLFFLMTSYLSNMTNILIEQGGTLDKYIGDAVMGFFGAPLSVSDHALRACRTALLMRERLPAFNAEITKHGIDAIDFRVGIATGDDVMVGNIGSKDRFNYTVLGDTVNLASRLEGTGKEYGVHIIIAHPTREAIGDTYIVRELDTIAVKGKTEGVRIYELIGTRGQATNLYAYEVYEKALALYRAGNYRDAGIMWEKQKDIDPPSRIMMERCLELIKSGTTLENGVYHMTHK